MKSVFCFIISELRLFQSRVEEDSAEMKITFLSNFFEEGKLLEFHVSFQQEKHQGLGRGLGLRLESAEIRNSLEGKTRARSLLQGSKEYIVETVVSGSKMGYPFLVRKWSSGVIFHHVQWNTPLAPGFVAYRELEAELAGLSDSTPISFHHCLKGEHIQR